MSHPITFASLWKQIRKLLILWLVLAIAAAVAVTWLHYRTLPARFQASAQLHFQFDGLENGLDPNGNRFDAGALLGKSVILRAAEKAGIPLQDGETDPIAHAISIESSVPSSMVGKLTKTASYLTGTDPVEGNTENVSAYVPTKYTVTLHYGDLGMDPAAGNALLQAILESYGEEFAARYGTNSAFFTALADSTVSERDYADAAAVLDSHLDMLDRYVSRLAETDHEHFRASESGYGFQDLQGQIKALKNRDLPNLTRLIADRGISTHPDRMEKKNLYVSEQAEITVQSLKNRVESLTRLIDGYQKAKEIVVGAAGTLSETKAAQGELPFPTGTYEISQVSAIYENLLNLRLRLQSELAEAQAFSEKSAMQKETDAAAADRAYVESELNRITAETQTLTELVRKSADEYNTEIRLNHAYQVRGMTKGENFPLRRLLSTAAPDIAAAEAVLFGILILLSTLLAGIAGRRKQLKA